MNRSMVRENIPKLPVTRYRPEPQPKEHEAEKLRLANTRAWLLYVLPFVAESDPAAGTIMQQALSVKTEPNQWNRYWAMIGQFRNSVLTSATVAQIIQTGDEDLGLTLAHAIAAGTGSTASLDTLRLNLTDPSLEKQRVVLRAIRIAPIEDDGIIRKLCEIVDYGKPLDRFPSSNSRCIVKVNFIPVDG